MKHWIRLDGARFHVKQCRPGGAPRVPVDHLMSGLPGPVFGRFESRLGPVPDGGFLFARVVPLRFACWLLADGLEAAG